jgi:hypothetical protein
MEVEAVNNLSKTFRYVNANGDTLVFDYAHGYLINKPKGIDTINVNISQAQGINQVGSTVQSATVQARPVTVSGVVVGEDVEARKNAMVAAVRPDIPGKLYADDYYLDVYVTATPTVDANKKCAKFQFSLIAAYPYWQKADKVVKTLYGVEKLFKFPWNISRPYQFGQLMKAEFVNIVNNGQLPVPFTATFTASSYVLNPKITNIKTGEYLLLEYSLEPGETVVVENTHGKTYVTSSVMGSIRGALDLDSTLFRLAVGDNVLQAEADPDLEQLEVQITFAPEIPGVTV